METYEFAPLNGKRVIIGVTASISLYRVPDVVRELRREGAEVIVAMSREAADMLSPRIMEWASDNNVVTEITGHIEHIKLFIGRREDTVYLISPASYNVIGKMANGISDDVPSLLFSFALGHGIRTLISPAMHEDMLTNPVNRRNMEYLQSIGVSIIPPRREDYKAKLAEIATITDNVNRAFFSDYLRGKRILVIGGSGEESIDPVRTITNHSSGRMGLAMAKNAYRMGASVVLIGNSSEPVPDYIEFHDAHSFEQFLSVASKEADKKYDAIIVPAALPDFSPKHTSDRKISEQQEMNIELKKNPKLIDELRKKHEGLLVAFRLSHEDDSAEHFSEPMPDIIVFNAIRKGISPFGDSRTSYSIRYGREKLELSNVGKDQLTFELLKIVSRRISGGK